MSDEDVTIADVERAATRLAGIVRRTPLWPSVALTELTGVPVSLKCESLQRTGSFKLRGASNMLATAEPRPAGVVAASAGNHAQGVALAARELGLPATVVMPRGAPLVKRRATRGYGAVIELVDGPLAACQTRARALAEERGLLYVPPYDHPQIVAGQGTVGLELTDDAPDVETVLVPAGGGGLLAGVALAVKARHPCARVIGVQTQAMPGIAESLAAGEPRQLPARHTIADGVAVAGPSALTLELIRRHVDAVVMVSEEAVARALLFLLERSRLVAEGAGALGVAALLGGHVEVRGHTVAVVSGGNIDVNLLGRLVERGLAADGRQRTITVATAHVPGELALVTGAVAEAGVNVVEVDHDLSSPDLPVGVARVRLRLDLDGEAAFDALVESLLAGGFRRGVATDLATPAAAESPR
jgi:threonine dehydratase